MTKDYIKDDGKVRLCTSNIAKMNVFESMYYHRLRMLDDIIDGLKALYNCWVVIINIFIIISLPITYPMMAWWKIKLARKEMKRHNEGE